MTEGDVARGPLSTGLSGNLASIPEPIAAYGPTVLRAWRWLTRYSRGVLVRGLPRRLRVAETVSLGDKRFVSILQVDGEQFLVGGSSSNVVLLAKLETKAEAAGESSFESVFSRIGADVGAVSRGSAEVTR